jgi:hypothetical protein
MITITITGADFNEVRLKAGAMFALPLQTGYLRVGETALTPHPVTSMTTISMPTETQPEKPKPGRQKGFSPKKSAEAEMAKAAHDYVKPPDAITNGEGKAEIVPSLELTKAAVNKVLEAKGVKFAHECLKHFGANRITELDTKKWGALIKHCEAQL